MCFVLRVSWLKVSRHCLQDKSCLDSSLWVKSWYNKPCRVSKLKGHFLHWQGKVCSLMLPCWKPKSSTAVSYQNESFSSKWELSVLPPSSLELWRKERARKAALSLMKNSQFDRTVRYSVAVCWTAVMIRKKYSLAKSAKFSWAASLLCRSKNGLV